MILIDTNLLIYAVNRDAPLHRAAKSWWEETLNGAETVGLPALALLAFLRITTRPGVLQSHLPVDVACRLVDTWLAQPGALLVESDAAHFARLTGLLRMAGTGGNLTSDAYLAALAMERNAELQTTDSDFGRFEGLRWRNPLA